MKMSKRGQYTILGAVGLLLIAGSFIKEMNSSRPTAGKAGSTQSIKGSLGPTPGPNADGYVTDKRAYLQKQASAKPDAQAAGLVSFSRLLTATDVVNAIGAMRADAVFLRFPGADPEARTVAESLEIAVGSRAAELAEAREAEVAELVDKLGKAAPADKADIQRQISERQLWINELKGVCNCVYAVAVGATTLGELQKLATKTDTRVVDVADPVVSDLRGWELRPILPKVT